MPPELTPSDNTAGRMNTGSERDTATLCVLKVLLAWVLYTVYILVIIIVISDRVIVWERSDVQCFVGGISVLKHWMVTFA